MPESPLSPVLKRVSNRDVLETYFARRVPGGAVSQKYARLFFEQPNTRGALLDDAVAAKALGATLIFLSRNVRIPKDPVDAVGRIGESLLAAWSRDRMDAVDDGEELVLSILGVLPEAEAREVIDAAVGEASNIALSEAVILTLLREFNLWANGEMLNPDGIERSWRGRFDTAFVLHLKERWLSTAVAMGVAEIIEKQPNFMSALFRWGQFDSPPYESVREAISEYLTGPDEAVAFSHGFAPQDGISMSVEGSEKLLKDPKQFLSHLRSGAPLATVIGKFNEHFGIA